MKKRKSVSRLVSILNAIVICLMVLPFEPKHLDAFAISCCKDGFDKSRYTLTGNMAEDVATIAKSQKGRTGAQFGYTENWCDEFVADCLENAGADSSIVGHGGTVADFESVMRKKGAVQVSSPQIGDLVFFTYSHVEIVTKVENGVVYCAGGNNGGTGNYKTNYCAGERKLYAAARLYLRPNYPVPPNPEPPTYSNLTADKTMISVGEEITFTASSDYATGFTIGVYEGTEQYSVQAMPDGKLTLTFDNAGEYGAYVTSYNSIGYADSNWVGFTVYNSAPTYSNLETDKTMIAVGEEITFTASSDYATGFTIGINKDGYRVITQDLNGNNFSYQPTEIGNYYVYVTSWNKHGLCDSEGISFKVYDSKPTFSKISTDKTTYNLNDEVIFKFESDSAIWYSVGIYKDGERYGSIWDVTNNTYTYQPIEPGAYSAYVTSRNSLGWIDSQSVYFDVYSSIEGDCNNDGEFNISDVVLLQKWLLVDSDVKLENWKTADLCEDDKLDVFDLCLMKRMLIEKR